MLSSTLKIIKAVKKSHNPNDLCLTSPYCLWRFCHSQSPFPCQHFPRLEKSFMGVFLSLPLDHTGLHRAKVHPSLSNVDMVAAESLAETPAPRPSLHRAPVPELTQQLLDRGVLSARWWFWLVK